MVYSRREKSKWIQYINFATRTRGGRQLDEKAATKITQNVNRMKENNRKLKAQNSTNTPSEVMADEGIRRENTEKMKQFRVWVISGHCATMEFNL